LQESAENPQLKTGSAVDTRKQNPPEESFIPGRPPDPSISRVGVSNVCPGCQSAEVRTLCRGEDFLYRATERQFLIVECKECRMIRLYPRPDPAELRRYYTAVPQAHPDSGSPGFWTTLLRRFLFRDHVRFVRTSINQVPGTRPVLDVSCGAGLFLRELNLPQHCMVGLDFSMDAAATAWGRNAVPAVCGALPSAPFPAGTFAAITMFQVLEHLYDPSVYVQAAAQLLCPEGRLIVQVPSASAWQFLLLGERWSGLDTPRHLLLFRQRDLESLLDYCGFEIVRRKRFSLRDDPLTLATSLAPGLNPEVRRARGVEENRVATVIKHSIFGLLWLLALPVAALESICGGGATLTVEARLKCAPSGSL
jgi:SAM-dependent methyltransferase